MLSDVPTTNTGYFPVHGIISNIFIWYNSKYIW